MKRIAIAGCFALLAASLLFHQGYAADDEEKVDMAFERTVNAASLNQAIDKIAADNNVWGYSVAVFEGEQILYSHAGGTAAERWGTVTPAAIDTKYRIASVSKMVSGMLVMSLVEQGTLQLEDDLSVLIHPGLVNPAFPDSPPQLYHLLTHTSGIYDTEAYKQVIADGTPFPSLTTVLEEENIFIASKPGDTYNYSNLGMGLTSAAVEQATGERFHDYANRVLFAPLNIDGGYLTDYVADKSTIAALANVDPVLWGNMRGAYSAFPLGQNYLLAQGDLYISAPDLAKILMILAGDGTYNGVRFLAEETVDAINEPQFTVGSTGITRGLGIQIADNLFADTSLRGHQGNAYGALSGAFYDPDTGCGMVFLTNGCNISYGDRNQLYKVNQEVMQTIWQDVFDAQLAAA